MDLGGVGLVGVESSGFGVEGVGLAGPGSLGYELLTLISTKDP